MAQFHATVASLLTICFLQVADHAEAVSIDATVRTGGKPVVFVLYLTAIP